MPTPKLDPESTIILVCDVQARFRELIVFVSTDSPSSDISYRKRDLRVRPGRCDHQQARQDSQGSLIHLLNLSFPYLGPGAQCPSLSNHSEYPRQVPDATKV